LIGSSSLFPLDTKQNKTKKRKKKKIHRPTIAKVTPDEMSTAETFLFVHLITNFIYFFAFDFDFPSSSSSSSAFFSRTMSRDFSISLAIFSSCSVIFQLKFLSVSFVKSIVTYFFEFSASFTSS
jgi:hypothetical protein